MYRIIILVVLGCLAGAGVLAGQTRRQCVDSADYYIEARSFAQALVQAQRSLTMAAAETGDTSTEYMRSLELIGHIYNYSGDFGQAIEYYSKVMECKKRLSGADDPGRARTLNNLCFCYMKLGRLAEARAGLEEALSIKRRTVGEEDSSYATTLHNLGQIYVETADYGKAMKVYQQVLSIKEKTIGTSNTSYGRSLVNYAVICQNLGNYGEAEANFRRAVAIFDKTLPRDDQETLRAKLQLAGVLLKQGKYAAAQPLLLAANERFAAATSESPVDRAATLFDLAMLEWQGKNYDQAEKYLLEIYSLLQNNASHPMFADCLASLGTVNSVKGNFGQARQYLAAAIELTEKLYGSSHPAYATALHNYAGVLRSMGDLNGADSYYHKAFDLYLGQIREYFPFLSESEKSNFYFNLKDRFDMFNCYVMERAEANPQLIGDLYNYQIATKAILLNSERKIRENILRSGNDSLRQKFNRWISLKEELARLFRANSAAGAPGRSIASVSGEASRLEKELSEGSQEFGSEYGSKSMDWRDIQKELGAGEAAIEIIRFNYFDKNWTDTVYYAFLIISAQTIDHPDMVFFSNGYDLEHKCINAYRNEIRHQLFDEEPYNDFWRKIDDKLHGINTIYVSDDGVYNQVNLNTLRKGDGSYLIDSMDIVYVTNTSEIARIKSTGGGFSVKNAALFGYPDFESSNGHNAAVSINKEAGPARCKIIIPALPGTRDEVVNIASVLGEYGYSTRLFISGDATAANLKALPSPGIIHIATHGYFEQDIDTGHISIFSGNYSTNFFGNPLLRSYLLFSGAAAELNSPRTPGDTSASSLLTAYDAQNLRLDSTRLVVLSACETGLGEIRNGEGVYGLQRAFSVAGARAVIMSLWTVNDIATQELMTSFYAGWLGGVPIRRAFRDAQLKLKARYGQPYYWGAFVLVGG